MNEQISKYLDVDGITKNYLFANTAKDLFDKFRAIESVATLSQMVKPISILLDEYNKIEERSENRTINDVVIGYALLISFTFLDYHEAKSILSQIDVTKLDWGIEIKNMFETTSIITQVSISEPKTISRLDLDNFNSSESSEIILTKNLREQK